MASLSEISIRRPVFAWMLMSALIIFGGISFMRMGVSQLPDVDFPTISVGVNLPGASPEVIETDIVDVIENAVTTIQGVKQVTSSSRRGSGRVSIEFELNRNVDLALQDVQAKIAEAQRKLPREMEPASISKTNPEDQPILWLTLQSETIPQIEMVRFVRDYLQQQFSTTPDVGDINLGGYVDPNLRVWISEKALNRYSLSVNDIINTIENEHKESPAGPIISGNKEFNVRTLGEAKSLDQFKDIIISQRGGQPNFLPITLGQVAQIEEGLDDIRRISRTMGKPAIGLGIRKQRGSNAVEVANSVQAKMERIKKTLPEGMTLAVNFDNTGFIKESVAELNFTLLLSAILTAIVCWFFLGSWSATLNVVLAIPTSILGTFIVLYFSGFTLNLFTLLGLSLAIGIVVDDAIMVLENITRHREHGLSRLNAALVGSKEITFAAIAATISILAIFIPVVFMEGVIGRYFFQFGVTMSVAVLLSLLEALTLTPMRCAQFVESTERRTRIGRAVEASLSGVSRMYGRTLGIALNYRWIVLIGSTLIFASSLLIFKKLNKELMPVEDRGQFLVRIQTPIGSSLAYTDTKLKEIEQFLLTRPEVARFFVSVGGFGGGEVNTGVAFVTLKHKGERGITPEINREATQQDLMDICRKKFNQIPDVEARVQDLSLRGFASGRGYPVEFAIQGPDWEKLAEFSNLIIEKLNKTGRVTDLDSDYLLGMPEIRIVPDRKKAAQRGVSILAIGETIGALIGGKVVGKFEKGGHRDDIRLKLLDEGSDPLSKVKTLFVRNNRGELIRLSEVVTVENIKTLQSIARRNRERAITVFGNLAKGTSQQLVIEDIERIAKETLPMGYRISLSGGAEAFKGAFGNLGLAFLLGLVVAYMVLASQFNSFVDPITVLLALPFSITGAFIALLLAGQSFNMYSAIGLLLLMGIVKKNSILLVDFTNQIREGGEKSVRAALEKACPIRLRPILMTSFATIVGAIPPALALGPGAESRIPMAVAVIGGVLVSTILTLYVVPCGYSVLSKLQRRKYGEIPELALSS
jgi:hydrophobe/amphiphile efflux-1 (HAE1) family protein